MPPASTIAWYTTLIAISAYLSLLIAVGARPVDFSNAVSGIAAGCLPLSLDIALRALRTAYRMMPADVRHLALLSVAFVVAWTGLGVVSMMDATIVRSFEFQVGFGLGVLLGLMWRVVDAWKPDR